MGACGPGERETSYGCVHLGAGDGFFGHGVLSRRILVGGATCEIVYCGGGKRKVVGRRLPEMWPKLWPDVEPRGGWCLVIFRGKVCAVQHCSVRMRSVQRQFQSQIKSVILAPKTVKRCKMSHPEDRWRHRYVVIVLCRTMQLNRTIPSTKDATTQTTMTFPEC